MTASPIVRTFFDRPTGSLQYVFHDPETMKGAIVDPVWNFCTKAGRTTTSDADKIIDYVREEGIEVEWVLDTHPHADHFSAGPYLARKLGAKTGIGEKVTEIQKLWRGIYNDDTLPQDGSPWDRLFAHGDRFQVGNIEVRVIFSPGHTLASITYVAGDAAFVHDTLMMPDAGSTRADFPGGNAEVLWNSIREILDLPEDTRLFVGHDYPGEGDPPRAMATVREHQLTNVHVKDGVQKHEFIQVRQARDRTLALPQQMLYALQVNLRGGRLPETEADGRSYFKVPANYFELPQK